MTLGQRKAPLDRSPSALVDQIAEAVWGKREAIEQVLAGIVAGGHVLLEDIPGTGKTTLVRATAKVLGLDLSRIQFTADLLPADIVGINLPDDAGSFSFKPGPVFANLVLADEINRTTPRTQSSLLEAMNERRVTVDGTSHLLPEPFVVMATQNPMDFEGTYPLPESQLDRFIIRVHLGYPSADIEAAVIERLAYTDAIDTIDTLADAHTILSHQRAAEEVTCASPVMGYLMAIVEATRQNPHVVYGASTRAAMHLYRTAKALAFIRGRTHVGPDEVRELVYPVLGHRLKLKGGKGVHGKDTAMAVVDDLLRAIAVPV